MTAKFDTVTLRRPDDWHVHLRDGAMLRAVLSHTARQFARAIVMPNLVPPVTDRQAARAYRDRILEAVPPDSDFTPLMTGYLTDNTNPDEIAAGHEEGLLIAMKLYPAGATTNSDAGVTDIWKTKDVLARMEQVGMPLLVHGEVVDPEVDVFDREAVFMDRVLSPVIAAFPGLKVVLEHVTTEDGVAFVRESKTPLAATVTAHHLIINRNALFQGGIRPHMYCLPIAKRERHRLALRAAATSGDARFFLGTDSAPHPASAKETDCGCAGIFTAPAALELYAKVFDEEDALDKLEAFASLNGPAFYGLPPNERRVTLERGPHAVPDGVDVNDDRVIPFAAGETLGWRMRDD